jgi:hypothetical protein
MSYIKHCLDQVEQGNEYSIAHLDNVIIAEHQRLVNKLASDGFWFVSIPRSSSSFVQTRLADTYGYPHGKHGIHKVSSGYTVSALLPAHTPSFVAKELIGSANWEALNTFAIMRHPYTWSLSLWKFTKKYGSLGFVDGDFLSFLAQFEQKTKQPRSTRAFFPSNFMQNDYLVEASSQRAIVKTVLRFEERDKIKQLLQSLKVDTTDFEIKVRETDSETYQLSQTEKNEIKRIFAKDFDFLNR